MAGMFYNLEETIKKLGKNEQEIKRLVKGGKLREFRDGAKQLFKTEDVDKLAQELTGGSDVNLSLGETGEIALEPSQPGGAKSEGGFGLSNAPDITSADTSVGASGINVLSGTDDGYKISDDVKAETQSSEAGLGNLDSDANVESLGSGSGLLDLSLQADDTSLGAVLDDILPAAGEGEAVASAEEIGKSAEPGSATQPVHQQQPVEAPVAAAAGQFGTPAAPQTFARPVEAQPDAFSNACGIALVLPLVIMIFVAVAVSAGLRGIIPGVVRSMAKNAFGGLSLGWVAAIVLFVVFMLIVLVGSMMGGGGKNKAKA